MLAELAALGVAHGHARPRRAAGRLCGGVLGVSAAILSGGATAGLLQPVVGVNLVLKLRGDLTVVIEGRAVLYVAVVGRDDQAAISLAYLDHLPRDQGGLGAQKTHLHPEVLGLIVLIQEQVVDLADFVAVGVVDGVAGILVFDGREPIAASFHACLPHRGLVSFVATPTHTLRG